MRELPILFTGPMVRAILDGTKTQTRRLPKLPPWLSEVQAEYYLRDNPCVALYSDGRPAKVFRSPYQVGDRLYVRETWQAIHVGIDPETGIGDSVDVAPAIPCDSQDGYWSPVYAATDPRADDHPDDRGFAWRPSIHMPRWAAHLFLDVVAIRAERLQAITEADAIAEGCASVAEFAMPWDTLTKPGQRWADNPLVWVIEFRRVP